MQVINVPDVGADTEFAKAFLAKYGEPKAGYIFGAYNYDAASVLFEMLAKATDGAGGRDALYATKAFRGVVGTFGFDANGDVTDVRYALKEVKRGKAVQVSEISLR